MSELGADEQDKLANEIVATGGVMALLQHMESLHGQIKVIGVVQEEAALIVRFPFLRSAYRLTVSMEPEENKDD